MMSVANICAVIVQKITIVFFNDVLVFIFMHFNCLRSCMEAIIPVLEFFEHVKFSILLSPC